MALISIIDNSYYVTGNASLIVANTNLLIKGVTFDSGINKIRVAAFDAFIVLTVTSKCLFKVGCVYDTTDTKITVFKIFHNTVALLGFGILSVDASIVFFRFVFLFSRH